MPRALEIHPFWAKSLDLLIWTIAWIMLAKDEVLGPPTKRPWLSRPA
ncbi:hypothetical protein CcrC1_gp496 [Caulobacter phage C1]|nr:hypothetical protein CcrC1_gp004 [Caulobacter phage C1]UTU08232.1 hypothetical protein CcrC2_gp004 [Caulobacter phage C2]UTU08755.1 hypothetical protein CcrJ4_gp004 [Caulobacter phage J4]UTU09290.1 hypothetical protein CcrBL47_gp004 [Caulobacter phage BL47]WGN96891.1 hypothetical protein [Bertelyvirus sp.]